MSTCCHCSKTTDSNNLVIVPKSASGLNKWQEMYDLKLNIETKNIRFNNFVCKSHLKKVPKVEEDVDDSGPPPLESQNCKEEDTEFVVKTEEPDNDYEQPSCSTSNQNIEEFTSRFSSDDIPNDDVQKYYMLTADDDSVECGFCQKSFENAEYYLENLKQHLLSKHWSNIQMMNDGFLANESGILFSKSIQPMTEEFEMKADDLLCRFILKTGLPLDALNDSNFHKLCFNLNPNYSLPSSESATDIIKSFVEEEYSYNVDNNKVITCSFNTTKHCDVTILAFTIQFIENSNELRRLIYFREIEESDDPIPSIVNTIKETVNSIEPNLNITNFVIANSEYESPLNQLKCCNNIVTCYYTIITKFVDELLKLPTFSEILVKLRNYVTNFPKDRNKWRKFKEFLVKRRVYTTFPLLDKEGWYSTIDFIVKCLEMHRHFHDFSKSNKLGGYLSGDDNVNLAYLHSVLVSLRFSMQKMITTESTIGCVIPAIFELEKIITLGTDKTALLCEVHGLFARMLRPYTQTADIYRFALFLDPVRRNSTEMKTFQSEWEHIMSTMCDHIALRETRERPLTARTTTFDQFNTAELVEIELEIYNKKVLTSPIDETLKDSIKWWQKHGKKFPILSKLANELLVIPAFAIDADHYFGESGVLSHLIMNIDPTIRESTIKAAGDVAAYSANGLPYIKKLEQRKRPVGLMLARDKIPNGLLDDSGDYMKPLPCQRLSDFTHIKNEQRLPAPQPIKHYYPAKPIKKTLGEEMNRITGNATTYVLKSQVAPQKVTMPTSSNIASTSNTFIGEVKKEIKEEVDDVPMYGNLSQKQNTTSGTRTQIPVVNYPWKNTRNVSIPGAYAYRIESLQKKKQYFVRQPNGNINNTGLK